MLKITCNHRKLILLITVTTVLMCSSMVGNVFCQAAGGAWEDISVDSMVDRSEVTVGDPIMYTLTIKYREGIKLEPYGWGENLSRFEIQDYNVLDPIKQGGYIVQKYEYRIATYYTENYTIPPITIKYRDKDNVEHQISSEPIEIKVNSIAPSEAKEIQDIKPPRDIPPDYTYFYVIGAIVLGLLILVVSIIWFVKWRKKLGELLPQPQEPARPAHEIAFGELDRLIHSGLLEENRFKDYYFELSEILRRYISARFGIFTLERTSMEILDEIKGKSILDDDLYTKLSDHFSRTDMVKFAKYEPSREEIQGDTSETRQFVELTGTREVEDETSDGSRQLVSEGSEVNS